MSNLNDIIRQNVESISKTDISLLEEVLDDISRNIIKFDPCIPDAFPKWNDDQLRNIYVLLYLFESGVLDDHPIGGHFRIN